MISSSVRLGNAFSFNRRLLTFSARSRVYAALALDKPQARSSSGSKPHEGCGGKTPANSPRQLRENACCRFAAHLLIDNGADQSLERGFPPHETDWTNLLNDGAENWIRFFQVTQRRIHYSNSITVADGGGINR